MENLAIEFYDSSTASVQISYMNNAPQYTDYRAHQYSDALIFANFALRMMRNLGNGADTDTVARMLSRWAYKPDSLGAERTHPRELSSRITVLETHVIYWTAIEMGLPQDRALQLYGGSVLLVPNRGNGKKRFLGTLNFSKRLDRFKLKTKGFGMAGKGIPQFGADSFFVLLAYLAETHNSSEFLAALKEIADRCGTAHRTGTITGLNCESLAIGYVNDSIGDLSKHI